VHPAARWNDGTEVSACDVGYSFELGRRYRSVPVAPVWQYLERIENPGAPRGACDWPPARGVARPHTLRFVSNGERKNPLVLLDALATYRIVPQHKIAPALASVGGDIALFTQLKFDHDPVASGPYRLSTYSSEKIVLIRDDHYWGNQARHGGRLPAPKTTSASGCNRGESTSRRRSFRGSGSRRARAFAPGTTRFRTFLPRRSPCSTSTSNAVPWGMST
jgi:peptide/nickel transport system substrate-binding protein